METQETRPESASSVRSELLTITQAARHFGCNERTVRRHIKAGKLPAIPDRGRVLVQVSGLSSLSEVRQNPARTRAIEPDKNAPAPDSESPAVRSPEPEPSSATVAILQAQLDRVWAQLNEQGERFDDQAERFDRMLAPLSEKRSRLDAAERLVWVAVCIFVGVLSWVASQALTR